MGIRFALDSKKTTALQSVHVINVDVLTESFFYFKKPRHEE